MYLHQHMNSLQEFNIKQCNALWENSPKLWKILKGVFFIFVPGFIHFVQARFLARNETCVVRYPRSNFKSSAFLNSVCVFVYNFCSCRWTLRQIHWYIPMFQWKFLWIPLATWQNNHRIYLHRKNRSFSLMWWYCSHFSKDLPKNHPNCLASAFFNARRQNS